MSKLKCKGILLACACAVLFAAAAHAHAQPRQPKGWRGITPLRSTHADVLRLAGKPETDKDSFSEYFSPGVELVRIVYADGKGCETGEWRVRRGTVLNVFVTPKKDNPPLLLSDLRLDLRKFKKTEGSGDVASHTLYTNEADGVIYEVTKWEGGEGFQVLSIQYVPAKRDRRLRCPRKRARSPRQ
jgi:hypothetical protein